MSWLMQDSRTLVHGCKLHLPHLPAAPEGRRPNSTDTRRFSMRMKKLIVTLGAAGLVAAAAAPASANPAASPMSAVPVSSGGGSHHYFCS